MSSAPSESDGWYPVEKVAKNEEVMTDIDPSIWVLFSKNLGSEKFLVRLPEDPTYRSDNGGFVLRADRGGEIFEVSVQKGISELLPVDSLYELEGKWVHEHVVQTGEHTFRLRTLSDAPNSPNHSAFISSFSISS